MKRLTIALGAAAVLAMPLAQAQQTPATTPSQAGEAPRVWINTSVIEGTVTGVDRANRLMMARDQNGREFVLAVGRDVPQFDKLQQGDRVTLRYSEAEALALAKRTDERQALDEMGARVEAAAAQAANSSELARQGAAEPVTVAAQVHRVDPSRGVLTLRTTDGMPVDILTSPQALGQIAPNDQIVISFVPPTAVEIAPGGAGMAAATAAGPRAPSRDAGR
ncbi:hypothetical protein [Caldimonas tepidiphila]|uniref:hypothetical protein n=1 Tax=Caldimonas tepidiphila TaxID=2315841 RepID=UPI000E5ACC2D|nr:hypothetical protein [Caldimonas tepidiphila]